MMHLEALLRLLALEGGSLILAIDEGRALHAGAPAVLEAAQAQKPTSVGLVGLQGALWPSRLNDFSQRMDAAAANPDVGHIVMAVDSPGGTLTGTPEAAAAVARARAVKPVTAHVHGLGASAAYWIASQAHEVHASPSAELGSIGVLATHLSFAKALAAEGIDPTIIRSTPWKAEGHPFEPLSDEAKAHWQSQVDDAHKDFVRAVAQGRRVTQAKVDSDFGKGRLLSAQQAVDAGMADKISTLGETLAAARTRMTTRRTRSAAFSGF